MKDKPKYTEKQIEKIKSDSIRLAILYRSLYILKKKFEKFKKEVNNVYDKYYGGEKKKLESYDHRVIRIANFFPLVQEIFKEMLITIPRIINPSDIFYFDIVNFDPNDATHTESIKLMEKIVLDRNNLEKYNKIYYNRRIKPLVESFFKNKNNDDVTECYKITEYDRKGRIVHTCDELLEMMGYKGGYKGIRKNPQDEYDSYMKRGDILFIDTLPIIIADFLQANPDFVVINLDTNDKQLIEELKRFFDDDILKRIREENEKNKNNIVVEPVIEETEDQKKLRELYAKKKKLERTLKLYENLLYQKKQNGESYKYILDFIDKLKKEIEKIDEEIKALLKRINGEEEEKEEEEPIKEVQPENKANIDEIDLRMREIFSFYCSQHRAQASFPTFEQISYKVSHMNISEFCKFCKDFKIPLDIDKLIEIYNKREPINENSEINYNEFLTILQKISIYLNENKKRKLKKKIDKIKKKMEGENVSSDSNEDEDDDEDQLQNELDHLNRLNFKGAYVQLQKFLEIDNPKKYRDKMKGFLIRYHDDTEKIEKFDLLTKEEILKVQEKVEKLRKIKEDNEKEKEIIKERKKKELFEIKKEKFVEQNKRLLKRIKEGEEKKTYGHNILKKIKKKEDKEYIINIDKIQTEELKMNLNNDAKKLLFIDENEENSDEDILEKYGVSKSKKYDKKIIKENINDLNEIKEKENDKEKEKEKEKENESNNINNNSINNKENKTETNTNKITNTNNKENTNDNISIVNTSNVNASIDIKTLKQNLRPKKKENIYFYLNKKNEEKNKEDNIKEEKEEKEKNEIESNNKKEEDNTNKIKENDTKKKNNKLISTLKDDNNKSNKIKILDERKETAIEKIYLTEPHANNSYKRNIQLNSSPTSLNRQIKINNRMNRNGSNPIEMKKSSIKDLIINNNKLREKNKEMNLFNSLKNNRNRNINKSIDLIRQSKIFNKMMVQNNDKSNNILTNSVKKNKRDWDINSIGNRGNIIKLPSVKINNIITVPNNQNNNINLIDELNKNNKLDILPEINTKQNLNLKENLNNNENNRYLLFKKNYNKDLKNK